MVDADRSLPAGIVIIGTITEGFMKDDLATLGSDIVENRSFGHTKLPFLPKFD